MMRVQLPIRLLIGLLIAVATGCAAGSLRAAEVTAGLSSRETFVGTPVVLTIEITDVQKEIEPTMPEVDGLEFRSLGAPSRSSRRAFINGQRNDSTSVLFAWQVTPQREGTFTIPSIAVQADGATQQTDPLRLVATRSETGDLLFVEVHGQEGTIFVGQPLRLDLKIWLKPYHDRQHNLTLSPANMWDMVSLQGSRWGAFADPLQRIVDNRQQPQGREVWRATSEGEQRSYYLYEVQATLYPRRPGQLAPGDVRIVVQYPTALGRTHDPFDQLFGPGFPFSDADPFFNRSALRVSATRPVVAEAQVQPLRVVPLPTVGQPDDFGGAVGQYEIVTQATPTAVQAGDPITLNIGIHGDGPMELVQAPPLHRYQSLTDGFKVSDEPLAGIVDGPVKLFSVHIRPRDAGVTQIPAIPFTFFDPSTEKYVTVHSDPIEIQVEPAENLALDAIVAKERADEQRETPTVEDGPQLANHIGPAALESRPPPDYRPLALALLLPPLAFTVIAAGKLGWPRLTAGRPRRAVARIRRASSPNELHGAVRAAVGTWLSADRSDALTRTEIVTLLQQSGREKEAVEIDRLLVACEQIVYAGWAAMAFDAIKQQALDTTGSLWRGTRPPHRDNSHGDPSRRAAAATQSAAALMLLIGAGLQPPVATADTPQTLRGMPAVESVAPAAAVLQRLTQEQRERIFTEANQAYQRGRKTQATDTAQSKQAFAAAAEKYRVLVDTGIQNDRLYVNLGNAYLQSGQPGRATASYLRALRINPDNRTARTNLWHVQQQLPPVATEPTTLAPAVAWLGRDAVQAVPHQAWLVAALGSWATLWVMATLWLFRSVAYGRAVAGALLLMTAVCLTAWGSIEAGRFSPQAVTVDQAVVRRHSGEAFPEVPQSPLPEGAILDLLDDRGEWLHVRLGDGTAGWIGASQAEAIADGDGASFRAIE